jgi:endoglucanase
MLDHPIHRPLGRRGFLAALAAAALARVGQAQPTDRPAHDHGDQLAGVPAPRFERLRSGVSLATWFRFPQRDDATWFADYLHDDDLRLLRELGFTSVRLPVAPPQIFVPADGSARADVLPHLDRAIDRLIDAGLLVVLDIHGDDKAIEQDPDFSLKFESFWDTMATRYKTRSPDSLIFELLNEPLYANRERAWHSLQARLVSRIRQIAPDRTIIATGASWGSIDGLLRLDPLEARNIVYSFHFYDPFPFTHQGATWVGDEAITTLRDIPYPVAASDADALAAAQPNPNAARVARQYAQEAWSIEKLRERLTRATAWADRHRVPLYLGEFGAFGLKTPRDSHLRYIADMGRLIADLRLASALWEYEGVFGLRVDMKKLPREADAEVARALNLAAPASK